MNYELNSWMEEFENKMIEMNDSLIDIINHEYSSYKIRDISELEEKVA